MTLKIKKDIIAWLHQMKIKNYNLVKNPDYGYLVDVEGNVDLSMRSLTNIAVQFGRVDGYFKCDFNELVNLVGSPLELTGFFNCSYNNLTSLQGSPEVMYGYFKCSNNQLCDLNGAPKIVYAEFMCSSNKLKNITGFPIIQGEYSYVALDDNPELGDYEYAETYDELITMIEKNKLEATLNHPKVSAVMKL